ncbi:hypothetical protein EX30DRAFT_72863 [Ascodesmis nigricans]|uniref:Chromo domain-containing protein n=1 Tax=Ascodesmis nigricans TaxID=341454 RepID=A0A4S2MT89_9PEZI|nr:hypothetical protein EX30DRAFT_72863 [Ascodesmis nigricans]
MGLQKTFLGNGRMKKSIIARPLGGQVWDPSPGLLLQNFEVAEILAKRDNTQGVEYLVSWKGKSADYYTWEPISNVSMLHLVYGSKVSPSPPSLLRYEIYIFCSGAG